MEGVRDYEWSWTNIILMYTFFSSSLWGSLYIRLYYRFPAEGNIKI